MDGTALATVALAIGLGFRHGLDADHVLALSDLTALDRGRLRRAMAYALGHLAIVVVLALIVLSTGLRLPVALDPLGAALVGATLVLLGLVALRRATAPSPAPATPRRGGLALGSLHAIAAQTPTQLAALALAATPAGAALVLGGFGGGMLASQGGLLLGLRWGARRAPRILLAASGAASVAGGILVAAGG